MDPVFIPEHPGGIAELADLAADSLGVSVDVRETVAAQMPCVIDDPRTWFCVSDQQRLKEIADLIATSWGENPADYVKVKFDVSERAYDSWPPRLKELFTPARTVETGKASYELVHIDGRRA